MQPQHDANDVPAPEAAAPSPVTRPRTGFSPFFNIAFEDKLVRGYTRDGERQLEIHLRLHEPRLRRDAPPAPVPASAPRTPRGTPPDLTGYLLVDGRKHSISAWFREAASGPFLSVSESVQVKGVFVGRAIGTINPMRTFKGQEVTGDRGLKMIGRVRLDGEDLEVVGYLNKAFRDLDRLRWCAEDLAYPGAAIDRFMHEATEPRTSQRTRPRP